MPVAKDVELPKVGKVVSPRVLPQTKVSPRARFDEEPQPTRPGMSVPGGLINPFVKAQLDAAGTKYVVADTMQVAGGGRGPAANYDANRNTIYYNPRHAREPEAYKGVMQHELVHAATFAVPGLSKAAGLPEDWRVKYLYQTGRAARGQATLGQMINTIAPLPIEQGGRGGRKPLPPQKNFFNISEGIATRGNAYPGLPFWGDSLRRYILGA